MEQFSRKKQIKAAIDYSFPLQLLHNPIIGDKNVIDKYSEHKT